MLEPDREMWVYKCKCGHITYFEVGGARDIICHKCWNYTLKCLGREPLDIDKLKKSQQYPPEEV